MTDTRTRQQRNDAEQAARIRLRFERGGTINKTLADLCVRAALRLERRAWRAVDRQLLRELGRGYTALGRRHTDVELAALRVKYRPAFDEVRRNAGTLAAVAVELGVQPDNLSQWLHGRRRCPALTVMQLARLAGVSEADAVKAYALELAAHRGRTRAPSTPADAAAVAELRRLRERERKRRYRQRKANERQAAADIHARQNMDQFIADQQRIDRDDDDIGTE